MILKEILYLVKVCKVPLSSVSKRIGLSYWKLRGIIKRENYDPDTAFSKKSSHQRFEKIHQRAKDLIKDLYEKIDHPLCLREI